MEGTRSLFHRAPIYRDVLASNPRHSMRFHKCIFRRVLVEEKGTVGAEYGVVFVLIALFVFLSVIATGEGISNLFPVSGTAG
jgi:Flp pilus assembly pilin Flp